MADQSEAPGCLTAILIAQKEIVQRLPGGGGRTTHPLPYCDHLPSERWGTQRYIQRSKEAIFHVKNLYFHMRSGTSLM